jgi:Fe-S cluster assembly protein SufD
MTMRSTPTTQDLTREIVDAFRRREFHSSKELREEAIHHFEKQGFPGNKNEEYRFTPITRGIEPLLAAGWNDAPSSPVTDITPYLLPGYECNCIVFVNGQYSEKQSRIISPENQLTVQSLHRAANEKSALVQDYLGKLVDLKTDAFAAFNTAFWRDGVFIHVPRNTVLDKPILVLHIHDAGLQPVISPARLLMIMEENSEASVVEKFDTTGGHPVFSSWVDEITVGEKATLNYCKIQNDAGSLYQVASTLIHQRDGSRVNTFTLTLRGKIIRNNFGIAIDGERCESHFYGLYLLDKDTLADNHTTVDHRQPNSFTNELYKGIMKGSSRGVFNGKIYVRPHAQKTNAFQSNRNILLTDTAIVHTKPQLEIWADDVKCSHGCTSGQLDEEALFYLQSRGIDKSHAQALLLYAFAGEILEPMKDLPLKLYLDQIISERLSNPS